MRQIVMIEACKGSPDGVNILLYKKGKIYDLPDDLANTFLMMGVAAKSNDGFSVPDPMGEEPETPENPRQKKGKSDKVSEKR